MNFNRMRALLLEHAIQGKLVPQLDDEPDVEQIGKTREEVPFDIPKKWKWLPLKVVCKDFLVPMRDKPTFSNNQMDTPWCRIEDIVEGKYLRGSKSARFLSEKTIQDMNLKVNPVGTVISACSASIGAAAVVETQCCTNQTFIGLVCDEQHLFNWYLYFVLKSAKQRLVDIGTGTTIKYISRKKYEEFLIPVPSLSEQRRIVAKLEESFAEIARAEKAYEELQTLAGVLRGQILQEAIQGKLVPQMAEEGLVEQIGVAPDERPFEIPKSWKWRALDEIFKFVDYRGKTPTKTTDGVRLITASNVRQGYVDHKRIEFISSEEYIDRQNRGISKKGDILFTTEAPLGNVALADLDVYSAGQRVITLQTDSENKKLLMYFMLSPYFQKALKNNATGTTAQGIKAARLKKLMLPVPPVEEQARIASKVEELLKQVDALSA